VFRLDRDDDFSRLAGLAAVTSDQSPWNTAGALEEIVICGKNIAIAYNTDKI
jgi:hypothetical protein